MAGLNINKICYGCVGVLDEPGIVCPHCGWNNAVRKDQWGRLPAMTLKDGRFFVGKPLGSGGFGVTYLGRDMLAGEFEDPRRAIKELFPMGMAIRKSDGVNVSPAASELVDRFEKRRERSRREGLRMASVSANVSNVVRAYDCFQENGTTYIVMEYIDGNTITKIVKENGPFKWNDAYSRLKPVLLALKQMHGMRIYHMDISPDNIMLRRGKDGQYAEPVILDFGASIEVSTNGATRSTSAVTVRDGYTPPEQYTSTELSEDAVETACMDEYAICATMYYAISGIVPTSSTARLTGGKIKPLSSFDKSIPDYFENAINKGMSLKVSERYSDIDGLIAALENEKSPLKLPIVIVAAALVVCAVIALVLLRRPADDGIRLDAGGRFTWDRAAKVSAGTLVGKEGQRMIRYTLTDGESVTLTPAMREKYDWTLEELQKDGATKEIAIRSESED